MNNLLSRRVIDGGTTPLTDWGISSETGRLKEVLVGPIDHYEWRSGNSTSRRHMDAGERYDLNVAKAQYNEMLDVYRETGVNVHFLNAKKEQPYSIYARDSSVMTPWGAIISQMHSPWRQSEWLTALEFYVKKDIPIFDVVTAGNFEGGDFMLIEPGVVLCGYSGERTNKAGMNQVKSWFEKEGWEFEGIKFDPHFLHMDVQCVMVAEKLAAVCTAVAPNSLLTWLKNKNIDIIDIPYKEAMELGCNIVSLGEERVRIQASLGENMALILKNHGLLSVGETVADAFQVMFYLNKACEIQLATGQMSGISSIQVIPDTLANYVSGQFKKVAHERQIVWDAWLRKLDRVDPSYKD